MRSTTFRFPVTTLVGSSIPNLLTLLRHHKVQRRYLGKFLLTFVAAAILELFNAWERLLCGRRIRKTELTRPPVFIIGVWRSGTTLLHNILCQDPRAAFTTTVHAVFPHLLLTQGWWISRIVNRLMPALRPFDNVKMDAFYPQEEEYGMVNINDHSVYKLWIFPGDIDRIIDQDLFFDDLEPDQLEKWKRQYLAMIRKALVNTGGSLYISKNPCNIPRYPILKEMFPGGKYIFIYRNPYTVVESLYRFTLAIFPGVELQDVPPDFSREKIAKLYARIMNRYFELRPSMMDNGLIEIKMEDFVKDKEQYLQKIYEQLDLGGFAEALPEFRKYLQKNAGYSRDSYEIHPDTRRFVNRYASGIVERLGYPLQDAETAP